MRMCAHVGVQERASLSLILSASVYAIAHIHRCVCLCVPAAFFRCGKDASGGPHASCSHCRRCPVCLSHLQSLRFLTVATIRSLGRPKRFQYPPPVALQRDQRRRRRSSPAQIQSDDHNEVILHDLSIQMMH
jgi:hypothetical protein